MRLGSSLHCSCVADTTTRFSLHHDLVRIWNACLNLRPRTRIWVVFIMRHKNVAERLVRIGERGRENRYIRRFFQSFLESREPICKIKPISFDHMFHLEAYLIKVKLFLFISIPKLLDLRNNVSFDTLDACFINGLLPTFRIDPLNFNNILRSQRLHLSTS